jgi:hypothetical protein
METELEWYEEVSVADLLSCGSYWETEEVD